VHQFVKVGAHSFTAIASVLVADLPPFVMCQGSAEARSMVRGLASAWFQQTESSGAKSMHKALYRSGLTLRSAHS
jgi:UDP-N-acetylglucosamine acyltransferase